MSTNTTNDALVLHVTDDSFERDVLQADTLVMVDFWAAWCGPCRLIAPVIDALATVYEGQVKVAKLDVDANPRAMAQFQVRSIPSVLFYKGGVLVDRVVGAVPRTVLEERLKAHL